ncbi:MAG TPA: hypothetical protein VLT59_02130 [Steroidobacteraceae bacterium]|nr:hypothetical protein [Steroidobacteraceae bacterium]
MSGTLVCWKCGGSLAEYTLPLRRLEVCRACGAELHVCKLCRFYDTSKAKHCQEPIAEEVRDKERANFCDYFSPRADAYETRSRDQANAARAELDSLFGGSSQENDQAAPGDAARKALEDLFK